MISFYGMNEMASKRKKKSFWSPAKNSRNIFILSAGVSHNRNGDKRQ